MRIKRLILGFRSALILMALLAGAATTLLADDRFSLALGDHGDLLVLGPQGNKVGDFTLPAIAQPVAISGGPSFQLSFGRDPNNMLSAILSPDPAHPADLHFTVLHKRIDADKQAVVTLTFSPHLDRVTVDPGYVGVVQVDSRTVHHDETKTAKAAASAPAAAPQASATSAPAKAAPPVAAAAPRSASPDATRDLIPAADASATPGPSVAGSEPVADSVSIVQPVSTQPADQPLSDKLRQRHLFWPEPVTGSGKNVPDVASNQMKLLSVHGTVSVTTPDGQTKTGVSGLVVPSGSTVSTSTGSSTGVLMGGVNSVRLAPSSVISVSQNVEGTVRHTMIDLKDGAAFSRVGREAGNTQDYEVRTPEGVAAARGTELMDARVKVSFEGSDHWIHLVFVKKSVVELLIGNQSVGKLTGEPGSIGMGSLGKPKQTHEELEKYLDLYLKEMQPFNTATIKAILDYNSGDYTADELALIEGQLFGSTDDTYELSQDDISFLATTGASFQDLLPQTRGQTLINPLDAPTSSAAARGR